MEFVWKVVLMLHMVGQPPDHPGVYIDGFSSVRECQQYVKNGSGWLMARDQLGVENTSSIDPVAGFQLSCEMRI